jgi:hypothetical protein
MGNRNRSYSTHGMGVSRGGGTVVHGVPWHRICGQSVARQAVTAWNGPHDGAKVEHKLGQRVMASINLDEIQPGMTLADDVKDKSGRILLSAGQTVTDNHLRIFKMWGIIEADVKEHDRDNGGKPAIETDPVLQREVQNQTDELFRHADTEHPAVKELYQLCLARNVRRSGEDSHAD